MDLQYFDRSRIKDRPKITFPLLFVTLKRKKITKLQKDNSEMKI